MRQRIDLRGELAEVSRLNDWLKERFEQEGVPDASASKIRLCLNEAVTNTISYGFPSGGAAEIGVDLDIGEDSATAELVDNGMAFNPLDLPEAAKISNLETARIGGFGVKLMRESSNTIAYERSGGRNRLTMTFLYS